MPPFFYIPLGLVVVGLFVALVVRVYAGGGAPLRSIALAFGAFAVETICFYLGRLLDERMGSGSMRWFGKIAAIFGVLLYIKLVCGRSSFREFGLRLPRRGTLIATSLVAIAMLAMSWMLIHGQSMHHEFSLSTLLFMLLFSGVDEELTFRGIMPSLLMSGKVEEFRWEQARRFCAFAVPTLMFTLLHAVRFTNHGRSFDGLLFAVIGGGACLLMWLRLRTGSLLSTIVVHNAVNAGTVILLAM